MGMSRAYSDWQRRICGLERIKPNETSITTSFKKKLDENGQAKYLPNEWLNKMAEKVGGIKKLADELSLSRSYLKNISKGYYPVTDKLRDNIKDLLTKKGLSDD